MSSAVAASRAAIIYDRAVTGTKQTISYAERLREVQACALMLEDFSVKRGDRVLLYMAMVPEALFGMLACAQIGTVHPSLRRANVISSRELRMLRRSCAAFAVLLLSCPASRPKP